jgi:hypothetical protein
LLVRDHVWIGKYSGFERRELDQGLARNASRVEDGGLKGWFIVAVGGTAEGGRSLEEDMVDVLSGVVVEMRMKI